MASVYEACSGGSNADHLWTLQLSSLELVVQTADPTLCCLGNLAGVKQRGAGRARLMLVGEAREP